MKNIFLSSFSPRDFPQFKSSAHSERKSRKRKKVHYNSLNPILQSSDKKVQLEKYDFNGKKHGEIFSFQVRVVTCDERFLSAFAKDVYLYFCVL
jgi:hypothetical protein